MSVYGQDHHAPWLCRARSIASIATLGEPVEREALLALSQHKLNALGVPLAYIDRNQRYRFANKALLDWLGKRANEVLGREVIEVLGRDVYQLYHAYIDAALSGERTGFERQLITPGRPTLSIRVDYYPDRTIQGHVRGFLVTYPTSTTSSASSSKRASASTGCAWSPTVSDCRSSTSTAS